MSDTQTLKFTRVPHPSPVPAAKRAELLKNPGFGRVFSDHMVTIRYSDAKGWHDARVEPRAPIPMDPAAAVLHYAQEVFEGLKAYRTADGGATLFRPEENARRFQQSATRLAMPILPEKVFLEACDLLVSTDRDWTGGTVGGPTVSGPTHGLAWWLTGRAPYPGAEVTSDDGVLPGIEGM